MILISLTFTVLLALCSGQSCDKGFVEYGHSCYIVIPEVAPWLISMQYCKAFQMSLVTVQTPGEYTFLKNYLYINRANFTRAPDFWTSGTHLMSNEWMWAETLKQVQTFYWGPGEPNNSGAVERCLSFYQKKNYTWNDEHCKYNGYPICEKPFITNPGK